MRGHRDSRVRQRETVTADNGHAGRRYLHTTMQELSDGQCLHHTDKAENDGENHDANKDDVDIHILLTHEPQHKQGETERDKADENLIEIALKRNGVRTFHGEGDDGVEVDVCRRHRANHHKTHRRSRLGDDFHEP